ncbi:hypothetical protein CAPN004_20340 [Capnocytophaga cynodegmi]|uniref:hypothetical protein n=1 Tax=Capnocytophaga cynodegmi TaxID=28189 RepID=UPI001AD51071|nr:hypothetical protein [Capnocytophaga cynodegmi]GIM53004.1 hypothetical protein CAPN004_20340 [Capnocytophaga cynodegmi]
MLANYFNIIRKSNSQILELIDKYKIQSAQYFPIFGFSRINPNIQSASKLKKQQEGNLKKFTDNLPDICKTIHSSIDDIMNDSEISTSYKINCIIWNTYNGNMNIDEIEKYLREDMLKTDTNYRKVLSVYDLIKYKYD